MQDSLGFHRSARDEGVSSAAMLTHSPQDGSSPALSRWVTTGESLAASAVRIYGSFASPVPAGKLFVWSNHGEGGNAEEDREVRDEEKPAGESVFHLHSSGVQKEIFACVGAFFLPLFSMMFLIGRSGNAVKSSLVVASAGSETPANLTGKVDSALMSFSQEKSFKQMHRGFQEGFPQQSFYLTLHTLWSLGSKVITKWLLRADPKTSLPCSCWNLWEQGSKRQEKWWPGHLGPTSLQRAHTSPSFLCRCGLYHPEHVCKEIKNKLKN